MTSRLLGNHGFFRVLFCFDDSVLENVLSSTEWLVNRSTLHLYALMAQSNLLLSRFLDHVGPNPDTPQVGVSFADAQALLDDRNYLVVGVFLAVLASLNSPAPLVRF